MGGPRLVHKMGTGERNRRCLSFQAAAGLPGAPGAMGLDWCLAPGGTAAAKVVLRSCDAPAKAALAAESAPGRWALTGSGSLVPDCSKLMALWWALAAATFDSAISLSACAIRRLFSREARASSVLWLSSRPPPPWLVGGNAQSGVSPHKAQPSLAQDLDPDPATSLPQSQARQPDIRTPGVQERWTCPRGDCVRAVASLAEISDWSNAPD